MDLFATARRVAMIVTDQLLRTSVEPLLAQVGRPTREQARYSTGMGQGENRIRVSHLERGKTWH